MKKSPPKKKRLVRGKDWNAWAWRADDPKREKDRYGWWAEPEKPRPHYNPTPNGKWVRVKFVEVDE